MNQKTTLTITAALTAFVLIIAGGIATQLARSTSAAPTSTHEVQPVNIQPVIQQPVEQQPAAPAVAVSSEGAIHAALAAEPGATLTSTSPELVLFEGTVAYEVLLDSGAVYVDANTGIVLYNSAEAARSAMNGHHDDDDEYEHDDDDEHEYEHGHDDDDHERKHEEGEYEHDDD